MYKIRNNVDIFLTNLDNVTHDIDALLTGFLIPNGDVDAYLDEVTGRKAQKDTMDMLKTISQKLDNLRR